jgi:hypothetical protein
MPPFILEIAFLMRIPRVSSFLPEVTQQIHSFRASGVMSLHRARAAGLDNTAACKSAGILCTVPPAIRVVDIGTYYRFTVYKKREKVYLLVEIRTQLHLKRLVLGSRQLPSYAQLDLQ